MALTYYNSLQELSDVLSVPNDISLEKLMTLPEIISIEEKEEDLDATWEHYEQILREALEANTAMRKEEGLHLLEDFRQRIELCKSIQSKISERSPLVTQEYKEKLQLRIEELLEKKEVINIERLENEVAYFADRSSITEELVRLDSHFKQFLSTLDSKEAAGRKLDFLIQEINREINTIGSKANDAEIASQVVEIKSQLEKIREQVQNIE